MSDMSENTSSDFLDQSYKEIDSSLSINETQEQDAQEVSNPNGEKKGGMSQNAKIISGVGVAALVAIGYLAYSSMSVPQEAVPAPAPAPAPAVEQNNTPEVNFTEPPAPVAEQAQTQAPAPAVDPFAAPKAENTAPAQVDPFAQPAANLYAEPVPPVSQTPAQADPFAANGVSTITMPESIPQFSEPVAQVAPAQSQEVLSVLEGASQTQDPYATVQTTVVEATQQVAPVTQVEPIATIANNAAQNANVDELRSLFDKHSVEIDKLDIRLTALEAKFDKSISEQLAINKKFEERLTKLESGSLTKETSAKKSSSNNSDKAVVNKETQRKRVKKASTQKISSNNNNVKSTSKVTVSNEPNLESATLVDKRGVSPAAKPKQEVIEIHSVFSGRLWIKKPDSTLETFVVGEVIPGGEKIKRIDEVGRKIYTDKRVISYGS